MTGSFATVVSEGLRKTFETVDGTPFHAIDDVSLSIHSGRLAAFVGPDGAGKTTLMRMMAGLLVPDAGTLQVLGVDVCASPQEVQNRISYMPQRFGLYEDLSVQENLDLYADLHGVPTEQRTERFSRLLAMTDLGRFTQRPAGKLSGGIKQKIGIARTLVRLGEHERAKDSVRVFDALHPDLGGPSWRRQLRSTGAQLESRCRPS